MFACPFPLTQILEVGSGWEENQLTEHPNEYIDDLCSRCALTWSALGVSQRKLPPGVLKVVWEDLIDGSYLSLLEGFSKVKFCSTEGRALMSMDLASFTAGVNSSSIMDRLDYQVNIEPPPPISPAHGMRYLDTYIKVFYYPKEVRNVGIFVAGGHLWMTQADSLFPLSYTGCIKMDQ